MGVSTDAILAFGIDLGDEASLELPWLDEDTEDVGEAIEDRLLRVIGGVSLNRTDEDYYKQKFEAEKKMPVELIYHCSCEYPMIFLAVKGTQILAARGYPERVDPDRLEVPLERVQDIFRAAEAIGFEIELDNAPEWRLFSMWC